LCIFHLGVLLEVSLELLIFVSGIFTFSPTGGSQNRPPDGQALSDSCLCLFWKGTIVYRSKCSRHSPPDRDSMPLENPPRFVMTSQRSGAGAGLLQEAKIVGGLQRSSPRRVLIRDRKKG
jgi:hypothetical protein